MTMASLDEKVLKIITTPIVDMSGIIEVCNELNSKTDEDVRNILSESLVRLAITYLKSKTHAFIYNTLILVDNLAKSCGKPFHRAIATRTFMDEMKAIIIKRTKSTHSGKHAFIKSLIGKKSAEMLMLWTISFKGQHLYSIFEATYASLCRKGIIFPVVELENISVDAKSPPKQNDKKSSIPYEIENEINANMSNCKLVEDLIANRAPRETIDELCNILRESLARVQSLVDKHMSDEKILFKLLNVNDRIEEVLGRAQGRISVAPSNPVVPPSNTVVPPSSTVVPPSNTVVPPSNSVVPQNNVDKNRRSFHSGIDSFTSLNVQQQSQPFVGNPFTQNNVYQQNTYPQSYNGSPVNTQQNTSSYNNTQSYNSSPLNTQQNTSYNNTQSYNGSPVNTQQNTSTYNNTHSYNPSPLNTQHNTSSYNNSPISTQNNQYNPSPQNTNNQHGYPMNYNNPSPQNTQHTYHTNQNMYQQNQNTYNYGQNTQSYTGNQQQQYQHNQPKPMIQTQYQQNQNKPYSQQYQQNQPKPLIQTQYQQNQNKPYSQQYQQNQPKPLIQKQYQQNQVKHQNQQYYNPNNTQGNY